MQIRYWSGKMEIIVDTREQLPLKFSTEHTLIKKKLEEGDYNVEELKNYLVIERKSLPDFYGSITSGHRRFRDEIIRSRLQGKTFYIFLEGNLKDFYKLTWSRRRLHMRIPQLVAMVTTMQEKYQLIVIECSSREEMSNKIISTININKKLYGV